MLNRFNEIGKKYGKLTVVERADNYKNGSAQWYCICDCGNPEKIKVRASSLRDGHTKSCGCLIIETTKQTHYNKVISNETKQKLSLSKKGKPNLNARSKIGKQFPETGKYNRGSFVVRKINAIINSAKTRKLFLSLTREEIAKLITSPCSYCGKLSDFTSYKGCNGIDRVDNNVGYEINNCVSCCTYCNIAKNDRTLSEFKQHIVNIYEATIKGKLNV
jgi:hypothetical protein